MDGILWLNSEQVAGLLTPTIALESVERALKLLLWAFTAVFQTIYPPLGGRENEYRQGRVIVMPAYLGGDFNVIGCKIIAGFPVNIEHGLPRDSGPMVLNSASTCFPMAVMDCAELSARRTGAVARLCISWPAAGAGG